MSEVYVRLFREAVLLVLIVGGPAVGAVALAALLGGLLQVVTHVQDGALTFIPKLLALAAVLVTVGPTMAAQVAQFSAAALALIPTIP